jgi:hypothetical protein
METYSYSHLATRALVTAPMEPARLPYHCPLAPSLPALLTQPVRQRLGNPPPHLFINPRMILQRTAQLDEPYASRLPVDVFASERPVLWVREPFYDLLLPYWPTPDMQPVIEALLQGQIPPGLSPETLHVLILARVLLLAPPALYPGYQQQQAQESRAFLARYDYALISQILNPIQIAALRQHFRELYSTGHLSTEDSVEVNRYFIHNNPFSRFLHVQIATWLNRLVPDPVAATYSFVSYYEKTGMKSHTDQDLCAWNLSLMVDPEPEVEPALTWPLYVQMPEVLVEARLEPGDMILYKGIQYPHWRTPLPAGQRATVCLFHFIAQDAA